MPITRMGTFLSPITTVYLMRSMKALNIQKNLTTGSSYRPIGKIRTEILLKLI